MKLLPVAAGILLLASHETRDVCGDLQSREERSPRRRLVAVALNICVLVVGTKLQIFSATATRRSEEHTSELQSLTKLVCRLQLEKIYEGGVCRVGSPEE